MEKLNADFLAYMAEHHIRPGDQLPTLHDLSQELDISVSKLREQLEVARALGLVDVRPRTGIRATDYSFLPAVRLSLLYALALDRRCFQAFSAVRTHLEVSFWHEAVTRLTLEDHDRLNALIAQAWDKLNDTPIRIPHHEHREFHLTIFARLENPFVIALLEAFWEAYEAIALNVYAEYEYLRNVWTYHQRIVDAIRDGDIEGSLQAFIEHTRLLSHRDTPGSEHPADPFVIPNTAHPEIPSEEGKTPEAIVIT